MRSKSHEHHDACEQDGGIGRAVVPPGRRGRSVRAMTSAALGAAGVGRDRRTVAHRGATFPHGYRVGACQWHRRRQTAP